MQEQRFDAKISPLAILASDDNLSSGVRLTGFNALPQNTTSHVIDIGQLHSAAAEQAPNQYENDTHDDNNNNNNSSSSSSNNNAQFEVVWHALSFDVATSAYDRTINMACGALNSLLSVGRLFNNGNNSNNKSDNKQAADSSAKPGELFPGQSNMSSTCSLAPHFLPEKSLSQCKRATNGERRNVFKNLSGYIRSGEISAILGPSGAGKTSLLNALCGGNLDNYRGSIQLRGAGHRKRRMQLSIIPQKDYLIENLTVRENLFYSSQLLNTDKSFDHDANIARVVKMLNLSYCLESPAANISGGEYKRVSIAQELLRQPDILILDEPTSGLDSLNCKKLIRTLKQLIEASRQGAIKPIAVVMTIHQPDIEIFNMFDHVYCMARRGRVIFDGHPSEAMRTIRAHAGFMMGTESAPPELADDSKVNPANFLIELASEDLYGNEPIDRLARLQRKQFEQMFGASPASFRSTPKLHRNLLFSEQQRQQAACARNEAALLKHNSATTLTTIDSSRLSMREQQQQQPETRSIVRDKRLHARHNHGGKFWYHTRLLTRRAFVSALRDPLMTLVSLVFHLFVPFVMWIVYPRRVGRTNACPVIQRDLDVVSMVSNRTLERMGDLQDDMLTTIECSTMLFITTYALSMCTLSIASMAFPLSMHILLKEVRNGWYDLKTFVLAKQLACFPFEVIFPSMTIVLIYIMLDMPPSEYQWRLWSIALVMAVIAMISNTHGLIVGTIFMDSVQSAVFVSIALTLPQIMLSGFTVRLKWLPAIFQHFSWLSQYRYSSQLINTIRFGFGICPCDDETDQYLRTQKPAFRDLPDNLRSMFLYYLTSMENSEQPTTVSSTNASISNALTSTAQPGQLGAARLIAGISRDLTLNPAERRDLLARMDSNEVNIFEQMAETMSRSLSFGHQINSCDSVRSQLLNATETNAEDIFVPMVCSMIGILLAFKVILFLVVRYKVGTRT